MTHHDTPQLPQWDYFVFVLFLLTFSFLLGGKLQGWKADKKGWGVEWGWSAWWEIYKESIKSCLFVCLFVLKSYRGHDINRNPKTQQRPNWALYKIFVKRNFGLYTISVWVERRVPTTLLLMEPLLLHSPLTLNVISEAFLTYKSTWQIYRQRAQKAVLHGSHQEWCKGPWGLVNSIGVLSSFASFKQNNSMSGNHKLLK